MEITDLSSEKKPFSFFIHMKMVVEYKGGAELLKKFWNIKDKFL